MAEKFILGRIAHKHATEAVWDTYDTFIPKAGEIVVYDADANHSSNRFKTGDGATLLSALPFSTNDAAAKLVDSSINTSSPGNNLPTSSAVVDYVSSIDFPVGTRIDTTIATTAWSLDSGTNKYKATVTNQNIHSDMSVLEAYVDGNVVQNEVDVVTYDGRMELYIAVQPSVEWNQLHMILFSCGA